jgi:hypothetical protein
MLKEEQAAELLRRCEALADRRLDNLRGNLRRAETRAAAVWEMIVFEASSQLGHVDYEDQSGGPDLKLHFSDNRFAWIEIAYQNPRFQDEERRSNAVMEWVNQERQRIGFAGSISCDFFGELNNPAGPVRKLPTLHEKKVFLRDPEVLAFFSRLKDPLSAIHQVTLKRWTVTLTANPEPSQFLISGGTVQESPRMVQEHAVYRKLVKKRNQHKVEGPRVICIGSDTSRAVGLNQSHRMINLESAISGALTPGGSISAVIVVEIAVSQATIGVTVRKATAQLYPIDENLTRYPLSNEEFDVLASLDFNRWKYSYAFNRHVEEVPACMLRTSNRLSIAPKSDGSVKLRIPGPELLDALAGRQSLVHAHTAPDNPPDQNLTYLLGSGWRVVNCQYVQGDVQKGLSELIELTLAPPHEPVYARSVS